MLSKHCISRESTQSFSLIGWVSPISDWRQENPGEPPRKIHYSENHTSTYQYVQYSKNSYRVPAPKVHAMRPDSGLIFLIFLQNSPIFSELCMS